MSKAMVRAQRAARRVPHGPEILEFLSSAKSRKALVAAAAEGEPPVAAISKEFAALVGPKDVKLAQVKQYAGLCGRDFLERFVRMLNEEEVGILQDLLSRRRKK